MLKLIFAILIMVSVTTSAERAHAKLNSSETELVQNALKSYAYIETYGQLFRALKIAGTVAPEFFKNPALPSPTDHLPPAKLKNDNIVFGGIGDPVVIKDLKSGKFTLRGQVIPIGGKVTAETTIKRIAEILERHSAMNLIVPQARANFLLGAAIGMYVALGVVVYTGCQIKYMFSPKDRWRCIPSALAWPAVIAYIHFSETSEGDKPEEVPSDSDDSDISNIAGFYTQCRNDDEIFLTNANLTLTITRVLSADKATYQYTYKPQKPDFEKNRAKIDAAAAGIFELCQDPKTVEELNAKLKKNAAASPKGAKKTDGAPH